MPSLRFAAEDRGGDEVARGMRMFSELEGPRLVSGQSDDADPRMRIASARVRALLLALFSSGLAVACMSAPMSERVHFYSAESPTTGPAGVPASGGTGAAGSFGSGGTMGGTTEEGARQTPANEPSPVKRPPPVVDAGGMFH
jgi:hypothetical protein